MVMVMVMVMVMAQVRTSDNANLVFCASIVSCIYNPLGSGDIEIPAGTAPVA